MKLGWIGFAITVAGAILCLMNVFGISKKYDGALFKGGVAAFIIGQCLVNAQLLVTLQLVVQKVFK